MDRKRILELLKEKKVQDYSFNIFFFLVFSIFVVFAIRPNLITAFNLQKELQELKLKNKESEEVILQIVDYQSLLQEYRDTLPILDETIPSSPSLAKAVEDVRRTASESGMFLQTLNVESIKFSDETGTGELQMFALSLQGSASTRQINAFLNSVLAQRRLKMFDTINISTTEESVDINISIKTYYL